MKFKLCREIFENYSNIKFHENPPLDLRSSVKTDILTDGPTNRLTDRQTEITNLIIASHDFRNAPKNPISFFPYFCQLPLHANLPTSCTTMQSAHNRMFK